MEWRQKRIRQREVPQKWVPESKGRWQAAIPRGSGRSRLAGLSGLGKCSRPLAQAELCGLIIFVFLPRRGLPTFGSTDSRAPKLRTRPGASLHQTYPLRKTAEGAGKAPSVRESPASTTGAASERLARSGWLALGLIYPSARGLDTWTCWPRPFQCSHPAWSFGRKSGSGPGY